MELAEPEVKKTASKEVQMVQVTADKIAALTGFTAEQVAVVQNTVAKGTSTTELAYFLSVAKSVELNPFNKEIWCYKDHKGNLLVFAGRDGFLKRAQQSPLWNGMTSAGVYDKDKFDIDMATGKVSHKPNFKDRGEILGAYAIVKPKGCELPTVEWADIKTYDKKSFVWNSHKEEMIKKVAEIHALKKAFGITVIQSDLDWEVKGATAVPVVGEIRTDIEITQQTIMDALADYSGADKEHLRKLCADKVKAGQFDMPFAASMAEALGIKI